MTHHADQGHSTLKYYAAIKGLDTRLSVTGFRLTAWTAATSEVCYFSGMKKEGRELSKHMMITHLQVIAGLICSESGK